MSDILGERDPNVPRDPTKVAEPSRESLLPKRFYKAVELAEEDNAWRVLLDGRPVRTPGKAVLAVDSQPIMERLATEWDAQGERVDPLSMPMTRLVNTAVDGVAQEMQAVREDIIRFAGTDLLCYRADGPDDLVELQRASWDPLLDWAETALDTRLNLAEGVMHVAQPPESLQAFGHHVKAIAHPLALAAAHVVTTLTGSAIIAMSVWRAQQDAKSAWAAAHVDEDFNISQWGEDYEATQRRATRFIDMETACFVLENLARGR